MYKYQIKEKLQLMLGVDRYQTFMGELTGGILSCEELIKKYQLPITTITLRKYADKLGYTSDATKRAKRGYYKRLDRIKTRQENMKKILNILQNNK